MTVLNVIVLNSAGSGVLSGNPLCKYFAYLRFTYEYKYKQSFGGSSVPGIYWQRDQLAGGSINWEINCPGYQLLGDKDSENHYNTSV